MSTASRWTPEMDAALADYCRAGVRYSQIAKLIGRSHKAVQLRAASFGIRAKRDVPVRPSLTHERVNIVYAWQWARVNRLAPGDVLDLAAINNFRRARGMLPFEIIQGGGGARPE